MGLNKKRRSSRSGSMSIMMTPSKKKFKKQSEMDHQNPPRIGPDNVLVWKKLLEVITEVDDPLPDHVDHELKVFLAWATKAIEQDDVQGMVQFLENIRRVLNSPDLLFKGFILVCHILDVSVPDDKSLFNRNLAAQVVRKNKKDFEVYLSQLLPVLRRANLDLNSTLKGDITIQKWLQKLARFILDESLPVPVTKDVISCYLELNAINPMLIEPVVGKISLIFIFNIDHVDPLPFWSQMLETYLKLRQVSKLVAKMLMALGTSDDNLKAFPLSPEMKWPFANVIAQLPTGQALEVWKTFLFHLESVKKTDTNRTNLFFLIDDLMSTLFRNVCIYEHSVPKVILAKIESFMNETHEKIFGSQNQMFEQKLPNTKREFLHLCIVINHYRKLKIPHILETVRKTEDLNLILNISNDSEVVLQPTDSFSTIISLGLFEFASNKMIFDLTKQAVAMKREETGERLLKHPGLQESLKLQTGIILAIVDYLCDVLDSDVTCTQILSPLKKNVLQYFELDKKETLDHLRKAFSKAENVLSSSNSDEVLDPKFYFQVVIDCLEVLPLESMHNTLRLFATLISCILLSLSTHEELHGKLLLVLTRCLDNTFHPLSLPRYFNCAKALLWIARLRYHDEKESIGLFEKLVKLLAQSVVKNIHEYEETWPNFEVTLKTLSGFSMSELERERISSCILIEALSKPLELKDSSREKLAACVKYFNMFLLNLPTEDHRTSDTVITRCIACAFSVWNRNPDAIFEQSLDLLSRKSESLQKLSLNWIHEMDSNFEVVSPAIQEALLLTGDMKKCVESSFKKSLWSKLLMFDLEPSKDLKLLYKNLCQAEKASALRKYLVKIKEKVDVFSIDQRNNVTSFLSILVETNLSDDKFEIKRELVEVMMRRLQDLQGQTDSINSSLLSLLDLQTTLLKCQKPLMRKESEAQVLKTCVQYNLESIYASQGFSDQFKSIWNGICELLSAAFLHRLNSLVVPRIPVIMEILRNLYGALVRASNQNNNLSPEDLKVLVGFSHKIDRILENIKKQKEDFARVVPYFIADMMDGFHKVLIHPKVKSNLVLGIHKLLDVCDKHSIQFLTTNMPEASQELFKFTLNNYNQFHKFKGKTMNALSV